MIIYSYAQLVHSHPAEVVKCKAHKHSGVLVNEKCHKFKKDVRPRRYGAKSSFNPRSNNPDQEASESHNNEVTVLHHRAFQTYTALPTFIQLWGLLDGLQLALRFCDALCLQETLAKLLTLSDKALRKKFAEDKTRISIDFLSWLKVR